VNELQVIHGEVETAPGANKVREDVGVATRSGETNPSSAAPTQPKPKSKPPPKPKQKSKYIGLLIRASEDDDGDTGDVVEVFRRGKKMYAKVKWTEPWKEDKAGNPVYLQNKPITEINAYIKGVEADGTKVEYAVD
jgi:hypothetical protein